jgi:hypothetical protein
MFAPALLFATYTTFGPVGQDAQYLYIADQGSIVRVDKHDPSNRLTLTSPTEHRIAAIDVDGDRVYYSTAPSPHCTAIPDFPPDTAYIHEDCALSDAESDHAVRSVATFGGTEQTVYGVGPNGNTQIAHDAQEIYGAVPSSGIAPESAFIWQMDKLTGQVTKLATNLVISVTNQHPFAVTTNAIYVVSAGRLLRVAKSGNIADVAAINPDSAISAIDDTVFFVHDGTVFTLDSTSGAISALRVATGSLDKPIAVLGTAPGVLVLSEETGFTHTVIRGWVSSELCNGVATTLGSIQGGSFNGYFIAPLSEPPIALDSKGIYVSDRSVRQLNIGPTPCGRGRAATH